MGSGDYCQWKSEKHELLVGLLHPACCAHLLVKELWENLLATHGPSDAKGALLAIASLEMCWLVGPVLQPAFVVILSI